MERTGNWEMEWINGKGRVTGNWDEGREMMGNRELELRKGKKDNRELGMNEGK